MLFQYWKDEYLTWDPSKYGGLDVIHVPSHMIWKPDIMVYNNANMNVEENELETNAVIHNDGRMMLFRSLITDITCNLDLTYFPFDQQVCYLMFASWSMDGSKVLLEASNRSDNLDLYIGNTEWTLTDFGFRRNLKYYACCLHAFPDLSYFLVLKRSPSYYIFSLVIPSGFITIVTIIGFFTPHSSTGENTEKVSLGVTALLSMAIIMMMVSDEMPATTEVIPLIGKYYIGLIFIIFLAAFTTTLTLSFQMRGNSGRLVDPITKRFFFITLAKNPYISWIFSVQLPPDIGESADNVELKQKEQTFVFAGEGDRVANKSCRQSNGYIVGGKGEDGENEMRNKKMIDVKLVGVENGAAILKKQDTSGEESSTPSVFPTHVLDQVRTCLQAIDDARITEHIKARIRFEWQQITRMIDRIIMILFIVATTIFATVMLNSQGEKIVLTDEVMNRVKH
uniref:Uncharacterized protein n=1 Tax=Plectus sambesii TaxID=2011161 RepID=A0A914VJX9_9BILA